MDFPLQSTCDFTVDPEDIRTYPGALQKYTCLINELAARDNLPDHWGRRICNMVACGKKAILHFYEGALPTFNGVVGNLRGIQRLMEDITQKPAFTHVHPVTKAYRIGQMMDAQDHIDTYGWSVLSEPSSDAFAQDRNGDYQKFNGVSPAFSTFVVDDEPVPTRPSYAVFPYKNKRGKIIRKTTKPRNPWIIFRASRHTDVKAANPGFKTAHLSTLIKYEWSMMDDRLKELFVEMARQEKLAHVQLFPDFKITPRKSETIPRRRHNPGPRQVTVAATSESL